MSVAKHFDDWAPTYESGRLGKWYQWQDTLALDRLELGEEGRVLDIGCGSGWALRQFAHRRPDMTGLGVDVSEAMILAAQATSKKDGLRNLRFRQFDWENSGQLSEEPFDAILCISAFHYFAEPLQALRRMHSALRPGGSLLLVERATDGSLLTRLWNFAHRTLIRDHVSFSSSGTLRALAEKAGFEKVRVVVRINRIFWKNKFYTSLVVIEARTAEQS